MKCRKKTVKISAGVLKKAPGNTLSSKIETFTPEEGEIWGENFWSGIQFCYFMSLTSPLVCMRLFSTLQQKVAAYHLPFLRHLWISSGVVRS